MSYIRPDYILVNRLNWQVQVIHSAWHRRRSYTVHQYCMYFRKLCHPLQLTSYRVASSTMAFVIQVSSISVYLARSYETNASRFGSTSRNYTL